MPGGIRKKIFPFIEVTLRYIGLVQQPDQIVARSSHDLSLSVRHAPNFSFPLYAEVRITSCNI